MNSPTDKAIIASAEMWCEQPGTRLLVQKDDNQFLHLTIKCGHIEVKATLAQFRIENLVAVANKKPAPVVGDIRCPKCDNYYGGHATGGDDICDCHMKK